jgi:hypothetical protein
MYVLQWSGSGAEITVAAWLRQYISLWLENRIAFFGGKNWATSEL